MAISSWKSVLPTRFCHFEISAGSNFRTSCHIEILAGSNFRTVCHFEWLPDFFFQSENFDRPATFSHGDGWKRWFDSNSSAASQTSQACKGTLRDPRLKSLFQTNIFTEPKPLSAEQLQAKADRAAAAAAEKAAALAHREQLERHAASVARKTKKVRSSKHRRGPINVCLLVY